MADDDHSSLSRPSLADPSTETVNTPPPLPPPPAINLNPPSNSTPTTTPHPLLPATAMANDSAANTPAAESTGSAPMRPGGAPARVYMNERIVPYLLEGMKVVAKEQPSNPLRVLGEFLIQKSAEVEGGAGGGAGGTNKSPE